MKTIYNNLLTDKIFKILCKTKNFGKLLRINETKIAWKKNI